MALCRWTGLAERLLRRPHTYLGIGPIILGLSIGIVGLWQLNRAGTTVKAFARPGRLVTDGIYRYTRNPIYLGLALMLIGACALFSARCALLPVAIFILVADLWFIRAEERTLSKEFGVEFDQYRAGTRRWI
jgi:protein-S-isoprenylcysteine O-methyltransferase Ste14